MILLCKRCFAFVVWCEHQHNMVINVGVLWWNEFVFLYTSRVALMLCPHYSGWLSQRKIIRCSVYTYPMTLHFINRRAKASLRHRNRAATTVLVCEQKPYPVWCSWWRERYSVYCEHNLVPRSPETKGKGDLNFQRDRVRSGYDIKVNIALITVLRLLNAFQIYPGELRQRCFNFSIINCIFPLKQWS